MKRLSRDVAAGLLFVAIGVAALVAGSDYRSGTLLNMGPGYFPRIVSALMIVLGALVTLAGLRQRTESTSRPWPWRALVLILGGLVLFGPLDVAGCAVAVGPTEDTKCLTQAGWFPVSFAFPDKTRAYCLPAKTCTGDPDCVESCKEQKDCSHPDSACTAGKCTVSDTCKTVGAEKYCLDHTPNLP